MDSQNIWEKIPHGKNDPPMLLFDLSQVMPYDFNEPDTQYVMFNRGLEGCLALPFSKAMETEGGEADIGGRSVQCSIQKVRLGGFETWWLAMKVNSFLQEYGKRATVHIRGFRDTDGNEMLPADLQVETVQKTEPDPKYAAHEDIALQAARDGIVLMKNENSALPLDGVGTLNFFGKGVLEFRLCAVGAGKINPRYAVGLLEAARGEEKLSVNEELIDFYSCGEDRIPGEALLGRAKERSDTAVMAISRPSGENSDNSTNPGEYLLTEAEKALLGTLRENFEKLVVILNVGYPIGIGFAEEYGVDALLYSGFGGMLAGKALMDVLTGRVNPSGRLTDTWPVCYGSIPAARNFYDCAGGRKRIVSDDGQIWLNTVYEEDIYVGYRYFETFPGADRRGFPFGHGLSYTTFSATPGECTWGEEGLRVTATVCNTGTVPGREVIQLYLSKPEGELEQPVRELVGFEKTGLLAPGEKTMLTINIPMKRMTSYDGKRAAYVMAPGRYRVILGENARSGSEIGSFECPALRIVQQVRNRMTPNIPFRALSRKDPGGTYPEGTQSGVCPEADSLQPKKKEMETFVHRLLPETGRKLTFADVAEREELLEEFVGNMDIRTLARIAVCACDGWGMEGRGEAGRLYRPEGLGLPEFVVADGNSGVNLKKRNIGMPSGATLCASFDRELMEAVGRVIGEEAKELGIQLILAPALNLHRNPLNGRHPEYFSEDPYLAGSMAGRYCKGLESTGVGGCYKHLVANNAESGRKRNQSVMTERALRELYFGAFARALEEYQPVSVMTAYNAVNGVFTSCDPELIQGLLFEECGFKGFVMTDWASYDSADVAQMAAAGNCWITPGSEDDTYTGQIEAAIADGRLSKAQLQDNVLRILRALVWLNRRENQGASRPVGKNSLEL